eukprot:gene15460-12870_t
MTTMLRAYDDSDGGSDDSEQERVAEQDRYGEGTDAFLRNALFGPITPRQYPWLRVFRDCVHCDMIEDPDITDPAWVAKYGRLCYYCKYGKTCRCQECKARKWQPTGHEGSGAGTKALKAAKGTKVATTASKTSKVTKASKMNTDRKQYATLVAEPNGYARRKPPMLKLVKVLGDKV